MPAYLSFPSWISPEIIPGLPFRWYGLMYLFAFAVAYLMFMRQVRERKLNIDRDEVMNFFFWAIVGLILGARIFAATVYDPTGRYLRNPLLIFWPFDPQGRFVGLQGMSYHGGLIGTIVAVTIYARVKKIDLLDWGDMLVAGIPLGYTFGRLGNFINGELYGRVTTAPWGMVFPHAERFPARLSWVSRLAEEVGIAISSPDQLVNLPRHPSQLYEALFEGILLWAFLWFFVRKRKPFRGFVVSMYVIGYGVVRFFIEYFREPDAEIGFPIKLVNIDNPNALLLTPWNFTTGQILNALMIVGGVMSLFVFRALERRRRRMIEQAEKRETIIRKTRRKRR